MRSLPILLLLPLALVISATTPLYADEPPSPAMQQWQLGQDAMARGETDKAIDYYHASLKLDPNLACNHLSLAAALLEKDRENEAVDCLDRFLAAQPTQHVIRAHQAELLLSMGRSREAREQFERAVCDAQSDEIQNGEQLVQCQSKLIQIAIADKDLYREHLHRGIGLYFLARSVAGDISDKDARVTYEGLLCQAAGELGAARLECPEEARPCWYLHLVWRELGQQHPATRWLRAAEKAALFAPITPYEKRSLDLACRSQRSETRR
jgi:tetratricopeptide (TPR) repeat protein